MAKFSSSSFLISSESDVISSNDHADFFHNHSLTCRARYGFCPDAVKNSSSSAGESDLILRFRIAVSTLQNARSLDALNPAWLERIADGLVRAGDVRGAFEIYQQLPAETLVSGSRLQPRVFAMPGAFCSWCVLGSR